ncbi:MAG: outer membrane beta-barrel protein [Bacteroides sp.]|nr:outer membrane beta-barrel protein [Bacteroides sp.]
MLRTTLSRSITAAVIMTAAPTIGLGAATPQVPADTTLSEVSLGEVTVSAPRIIHKADMDVLYPSKSAVENSQNGVALLRNLMIPTLSVSELTGSIRTGGEDVEIRINGRQASVDQLLTVDPTTVRRIEWLDNPGLRYGNAPGVINVITVNPTAGGSVMTQGFQALDEPWGNGYADLKLNNGRSQWGLNAMGRYTNRIGSYREYSETFTRPDGTSVTRTETPVDGFLSMTDITPQVSYNYINPDKIVVWADFSVRRQWPTRRYNEGLMELSGSEESLNLREHESSSGVRPRLNAYIEQHLPHRQTIALDASATVFNGRSTHDYTERAIQSGETLTDVHTLIRERTHTLRVEGNYIKNWVNSRLTAGGQYNATRSRSRRESGHTARQRRDQTYFFGEYFQRVGAVSLTGGIGAQYIDLTFNDSGTHNTSWSLRPRFSAAYRLNQTSQLRLNFTTWQTSPSLSQTDPTPQQIDGFQYQTGNPDLRTYNTYRISVQYNFVFPRVSGKLEGRWTRKPDPITPWLEWEGDRLITSFENSRGETAWQVTLSPQVEIIPKYLTASGVIRYIRSESVGTGYRHRLNNWSGHILLTATYGNFSLSASYQENPATLSGEVIAVGEKTSDLLLNYRTGGFKFGVGMFMPFNRYSMSSKSLNRYNSNYNILRSSHFDCMPIVQVAYNFNWGKQKKGARKLIDSSDDVEQSKAAGR